MGKQTKVLHGSCSEVYINGQRDVLATKIEVKVTGDFEDGALEVAIAEGFESGVMPDIVLITALTQPSTKKVERWSISGVVFTEVALANIEAKKSVDRELPFKAEKYKNLEAIE